MRRGTIGTAAIVIALAGPASPAIAKPAKTKVTIGYTYFEIVGNEAEFFAGEVKSKKDKCEVGRKVKVFRKKPGKDESYGEATSTREMDAENGSWFRALSGTTVGPEAENGKYYAIVTASNGCEKAVSDTIKVPPPQQG